MNKFVWLYLGLIFPTAFSAAATFQDCMDKLHLQGNADKKAIYVVTDIGEAQGINDPPKPRKTEEIRTWTPSGNTVLWLGSNGCTSSRKENVYDYIASSIEFTSFVREVGKPAPNEEALREEMRASCRGISKYLDDKLASPERSSGLPSDHVKAVKEGDKPN